MGVIICWVVFAVCGVVAALYVYRFSNWVVRLVGAVRLPRPVLAALSAMAVVATLVSGKVPLLSLPPPTLIPDVVDVEQTDDDVPPVTDLRFTAITPGDDAVTLAFAWPESWTFTNGFLDLYGCSDLAAGDWRRLAQVDVSLAGSNAVVTLPHVSFPAESVDRMAFFRLASQDDTDGDGLPDKFEDWCFKTDPLLVDSENDGLDDGDEEALGTNPQESDTDGDGLTDIEEAGRISVAPSFEWHDTTGGSTCWSSWDPEGGASSGGWSWDAIEGWNGAYLMSWFPASRWIAGRECTFVTACEVGHVTVAGPGDLWWVYPEEVQSLDSASNCGTILVAPYWSDLALKYGDADSFIRTAVDALDGAFVVEFHNVRKGLDSELKMTFQVIVPASGDEVRVSYLSSDVWMDGVGAVVGVQAGRSYLPERGYYNLTWDFARRGPILPQTTVVYRLGTGTDPLLADSDGDGLDDCCELETSFTNPFDDDMDGDGLTDGEEVFLGTYPNRADSDQDGFPDGWEHEMGLDPRSGEGRDGRLGDHDGDGLTNEYERWRGTHPCMSDTDGDGLDDGDEISVCHTDPLDPDMDGDGLDDGDEIMLDCDPLEPDSDGDGMLDGWEVSTGMDPVCDNALDDDPDNDLSSDPDNDGLTNWQEFVHNSHPYSPNSFSPTVPDFEYVQNGMSEIPPEKFVELCVSVGDSSGSCSERWGMVFTDAQTNGREYYVTCDSYGEVNSQIVRFERGRHYVGKLVHYGSMYETPDYDWTVQINSLPITTVCSSNGMLDDNERWMVFSDSRVLVDNQMGLLGISNDTFGEENNSSGKEVHIYILDQELIDHGASVPNDAFSIIDSTPAMPDLILRLLPLDLPGTFETKVKVEYSRGPANQLTYFPGPGADSTYVRATSAELDMGTVWGESFLGGKVTFTSTYKGCSFTNVVHIRGANPSDQIIEREIGSTPWYIKAIARRESGQQGVHRYCQFNYIGDLGTSWNDYKYCPNFGSPNGWGIFKLDPPVNKETLWNWKTNIRQGCEVLVECIQEATNWIGSQVAQQQQEDPLQPLESYVFTINGVDFQMGTARTPIDACAIQRYNGAPRWVIYWQNRTPTTPGRWRIHEQSTRYVIDVLNCLP